MLVLARRADGRIIIEGAGGGRVVLTVVEIRRDVVRLGFEAADDVTILREELLSRPGGERGRR